jgi:hypothetical protein
VILKNQWSARPQGVLRIGLVFLILASLWKLFVHPGATFSDGFVDGSTGFLYGLAIGTLLLGIWLTRRSRSGGS